MSAGERTSASVNDQQMFCRAAKLGAMMWETAMIVAYLTVFISSTYIFFF